VPRTNNSGCDTTPTSIRIPTDLRQSLEAEAWEAERPFGRHIIYILRQWLRRGEVVDDPTR